MTDENSKLEQLNILVTILVTVFGGLISWQTFNLNAKVDRLNENIEASSLVGELIDSLTSDDAKQDIALLALDNALSSESDESIEMREERYKELVAKIARNLLNRSLKISEGEDGASLGRQIREETRTARDILKNILEEPGFNYGSIVENENLPDYKRVAAEALMEYEKRVSASNAPTDTAQVQLNYAENEITNSNEVIKPEVTTGNQSSLQQEQQTLELATSADAVSGVAADSENKEVVYLHYDDSGLAEGMEQLKNNLSDDWFVTDLIKLVDPTAFNCSVTSDIRFFHEEDADLAKRLKEEISNTTIESLTPYVGEIRLIDLSNWEKAELVPQKQLELWIVVNGQQCSDQRNSN